VITDGQDYSGLKPFPTCKILLSHRIILDAFLLPSGENAENPELERRLLACCSLTGGRAFRAKKEMAVLSSEQFLDLALREIPPRRDTWPSTQQIEKLPAKISECDLFDFTIPFSQGDTLQALGVMQLAHQNSASFRIRRILQEMAVCRKKGIPLFAVNKCIDNWRVFLRGPKGDEAVLWDLAISFGNDYPYRCPVFRFLSIPEIDDVSKIGRVEYGLLRYYHPRVQIATILNSIERGLRKVQLPERYGDLIAARKRDPWLPIPYIEHLWLISEIQSEPDFIEGTSTEPDASTEFSDITWEPIEPDTRVEKCGIRFRPGEEKFFRDLKERSKSSS
jgi:ubiquitin-protein ligase